jgi:hypothetical protein
MSQWCSSSIDARSAPTTALIPTVVIANHNGVLVAKSGRKLISGLDWVATPLERRVEHDGEQNEQRRVQ